MSTSPPPRFVLYARKSQEREDRQVQSLEDQVALAQKLAKERDFVIVHAITEAHSAKTQGTRLGFKEVVQWINGGKADGILCWHPDRLARNAVDGGWVLDLLDRGKLNHLVFTSGYHFDNTPEGKFMLGMVFSQAKYQVDKLVKDVTRGMVSKRERGGFPHRAPEGWMNFRDGATGQKTIIIDKERFALLRQAIDLILSETLVPAQALRTLNEEWSYSTRPTKKRAGGPLAKAAFYKLLCNPFLKGMCRHAGGLYQGTHPPMLTPDEFDRLQFIVSRPEKHRTATLTTPVTQERFQRHEHSFTGLLRCARCGQGMITATQSKGYIYYHCTNQKGVCSRRGVREEVIQCEVGAYLDAIRLPESLSAPLLDLMARHLEEQGVVIGKRERDTQSRVEVSLLQIEAQQKKLRSLLLRDVLSEADYASEKARLIHEETALRERLVGSSYKDEHGRVMEAARKAVGFAVTAPIAFSKAYPHERRQILRYLSGGDLPEAVHPRPRLDVSLTGEKVVLKPHPHLIPFQGHSAALPPVEPGDNGSDKRKRPTRGRSFSFGGTEATLEQLAVDILDVIIK